MTTWAMKTSMERAQNHVTEGDVREVELFGLKQESTVFVETWEEY